MSNPIKLHKRPSIKTQGTMRATENETHVKTTIPHLPKINSADVKENDVKQRQIPISHIADYFMERKETLKLDVFRWERENISQPSNLPLVIRSFGSGNDDNVTHKEKRTENRKGRKCCALESSKTRKNPPNSLEGSKNTNSDNTGLGVGDDKGSSSLRQYNGLLTAKFQKARINVAAKFQGGHWYAVDGGNTSVKSANSAKIAKSLSDPVARMKWTKGFVNRQYRPSAMLFAEKGSTR
ncbi:uncharacterized protein [Narcine bancroftii]|uniref:uncharacterized protein isoform X2 n=1 Tax=Narcine bancroftii TaxID=1343680 RepID=UPI0038322B3F